jgi:hypothetical protein
MMPRKITIGFFILVLLIVEPASSSFGAESKEAAKGQNPLIEEMKILDATFREIVSAVAVGDGVRVVNAIKSMHGTMEKTHEELHSGAVRIPRNSGREKEFVRLDKSFHLELEKLGNAANSGKKQEMLSRTKKLLDGCVQCHGIFR